MADATRAQHDSAIVKRCSNFQPPKTIGGYLQLRFRKIRRKTLENAKNKIKLHLFLSIAWKGLSTVGKTATVDNRCRQALSIPALVISAILSR